MRDEVNQALKSKLMGALENIWLLEVKIEYLDYMQLTTLDLIYLISK